MIDGFYYLHTNGDLIFKPMHDGLEGDLRESDFVRAFWPVDKHDRKSAWDVIVESWALGANLPRVISLANQWRCDDSDADTFAMLIGVQLMRATEGWAARPKKLSLRERLRPGFLVGIGGSKVEAIAMLAREMGLEACKGDRAKFTDLLEAAAKETTQ